MRKVLFRILIAMSLFLVVLLGVSFYKNQRPLHTLQLWFGVKNNVVVTPKPVISDTAEQEKKADVNEQIQNMVNKEATSTNTVNSSDNSNTANTSNTTTKGSTSSTLTEDDKKAIRGVVDGLIAK